ncbi:MAG: helix-turn-helix domain-containing protein [Dokdonella sp.]
MKTRESVKRTYRSTLRQDQTQVTRHIVVEAAARLFAEDGYAAVSMGAIAEAAGVSRATVFNAVGGKSTLLAEAYAMCFGLAAGMEQRAMPLVERPRSLQVRAQPTAQAYIEDYCALFTSICVHLARIHEALREAACADRQAHAYLERVYSERRRGAATIVADVQARMPLRPGLDSEVAADAVWAMIDPSWYHLLVHRCGWADARFQAWLARALASQLLA